MADLTVSEARARLADVVDDARVRQDPVFLTRRGRRVVAVVDADQLDQLLRDSEDLADLQAAAQARTELSEAGGQPIPWEQVKVDLGLT